MREWLYYPDDMRNPMGYCITAGIVVIIFLALIVDVVGCVHLL